MSMGGFFDKPRDGPGFRNMVVLNDDIGGVGCQPTDQNRNGEIVPRV